MHTDMWLGVKSGAAYHTYADGSTGIDVSGVLSVAGQCMALRHGGIVEYHDCSHSKRPLCEAPCPQGTGKYSSKH